MPITRKRQCTFNAFTAMSALTTEHTSCAASSTQAPTSPYIDNGDCNCVCEHCNALFWFDERLTTPSSSQRPKYSHCCKGGRVKLPEPMTPPAAFVQLLDRPEFVANIRAYNCMFSMTSFGANIDDSINDSSGPYVFKIGGHIYHWLGSYLPPLDEQPRFLQMYIYDTDNEVSNRLRFFQQTNSTGVDAGIVRKLIQILNDCNGLVKLFRNARDLCESDVTPSFCIRLFSSYNSLRYDDPAPGCIGAIVSDVQPDSEGFDIVIRHKDLGPQHISNLHPLYMSLQYPLLFIHGESGWSPNLPLNNTNRNLKREKITDNMFYSYQLHDRPNVYTLLLRGADFSSNTWLTLTFVSNKAGSNTLGAIKMSLEPSIYKAYMMQSIVVILRADK